MAKESATIGAEAARVTLEASASITREALSVSLKIDSPIVAGVALAAGAAVTLGAFYLRYRWKTENAIRNSLERMNAIGAADPEVTNIEEGSIIVKLRCRTPQSVLQFVKDFKEKKVKRRLEEELKKIGFDEELEVTIVNGQEVFQREQELRSLHEPQEDVKVTFEELNLEAESRMRGTERRLETEMRKLEIEKRLKEIVKRLRDPSKFIPETEMRKLEAEKRRLDAEMSQLGTERRLDAEMSQLGTERRLDAEMRKLGLEMRIQDAEMRKLEAAWSLPETEMRKHVAEIGMQGREERLQGAGKTPEDPSKLMEEKRK